MSEPTTASSHTHLHTLFHVRTQMCWQIAPQDFSIPTERGSTLFISSFHATVQGQRESQLLWQKLSFCLGVFKSLVDSNAF